MSWIQDEIEAWVSDYIHGPTAQLDPAIAEQAPAILVTFLREATASRGVAPSEIEQADVRKALLEGLATVDVTDETRGRIPSLIREFLLDLQDRGRLADGEQLGRYAAALREAYKNAASPQPLERVASKVQRNDPCPCGSGRKYKKCCMNALE